MRGSSLQRSRLLDQTLCWYFGTIFALSFTQADRLLSKMGLLAISPSLLFLVLTFPVACVAIARELRSPSRGARVLEMVRANLAVISPFAILAALSLLWSLHPTANWQSGGRYILLVLFDLAIFLLALSVALLAPIRRRWRHFAFASWLLMVVTVGLDLVVPGLFSDQVSRAAGLAEDANVSAFLLLSSCALILTYGKRPRVDAIFLAVTSAAVLVTFSRGGFLLLGLLLLSYFFHLLSQGRSEQPLTRWVPLAVAVAVLVGGLGVVARLAASDTSPFSRQVTRERIGMLTGESEFFGQEDQRVRVLRTYGPRVADAPLLGYGTGHSYLFEVGPHNRYLQEWINLGLPGLLAYLALIGGALVTFRWRKSAPGTSYVLIIAAWGLLSQGVLEQRSVPLSLALLAAATLKPKRAESEEGEIA